MSDPITSEITSYETTERSLPILPVRDTVLFPHAVLPLTVGRESSVQLINSLGDDKTIVVVAQREARVDSPQPTDLYSVGTLAVVHKVVKMPNQSLFVFAEGLERVKLADFAQLTPFMRARVTTIPEMIPPKDSEIEALQRNVLTLFQQIVAGSPTLSDELSTVAMNIEEPGRLVDFIASSLPSLSTSDKQDTLETTDVRVRLEKINQHLAKELEVQQLRNKIQTEVQDRVQQTQREYYLREQMKAIQKELGEQDEGQRDTEELKQKIESAGMPDDVKKEALKELGRLARMSPMAADYSVTRNYIEWLAVLPWAKTSGGEIDIPKAKEILDADHYDLEKVKDRILDYLSVRRLKPSMKGPILCFVGPPGVGKTSLGKSIARALGRKFTRLSLGGVHDEAEIRGHRRTYIGALPGQIIQGIRRAETKDPGLHARRNRQGGTRLPRRSGIGAARSARSRAERDLPRQLSGRDFRSVEGTVHHHRQHARSHCRAAARPHGDHRTAGLHRRRKNSHRLPVPDPAADRRKRNHQRADRISGRGGQLHHSSLHARSGRAQPGAHHRHHLPQAGAPHRRRQDRQAGHHQGDHPGISGRHQGAQRRRNCRAHQARGRGRWLAWTPSGGDVLFVEANQMKGKGGLTITGQIQDVMRESMQAGLSWVRSNAKQLGIDEEFFANHDIHIHVPAGAIPKDGPSAGVTIVTALVSLLTGKQVRPLTAMTGEITLSGNVLPVGGIKEKVLAAKRAGVHDVILPAENRTNVEEDLTPEQLVGLTAHYVKTIEEVLEFALPSYAARGTAGRRRARERCSARNTAVSSQSPTKLSS